jgi:hypothetical protein
MLPVDGAPGGKYDVEKFGLDKKYSQLLNQTEFCFVPTVSALCLDNWKDKLTSNLSSTGSDTYYYDFGYTPFEKYFSQSVNKEHVDFSGATTFLYANLGNGCSVPINESDLYVKDYALDSGLEGFRSLSTGTDYCSSPDIWVEDTKNNTVTDIRPNTPYNICVRVRNRGNKPSNKTGRIFIHWSRDSYNLDWRSGWENNSIFTGSVFGDVIKKDGALISTVIEPSDFYIHMEPWISPTDIPPHNYVLEHLAKIFDREISHNYGFLARIHDGNPISNERSRDTDLAPFVIFSNNVAVNRSYTISGKSGRLVFVQQHAESTCKNTFDLKIDMFSNTDGLKLPKFAEVYIMPDENLLAQWKKNGCKGEDFKLMEDGSLLITSEKGAVLRDFYTSSEQVSGFGVFVNFLAKEVPETNEFKFNIAQINMDSKDTVDYPFVVVRNPDRYFAVQAHAEAILKEKSLILKADPLGESAKYMWFDYKGNHMFSEREIEIDLPKQSQWFKLAVIADADHYTDYDSVFVFIPPGFIVSLTPNPAQSTVYVEYFLSEATPTGSLMIYNNIGNLVSNEPVTNTRTMEAISLNYLLPGTYSIVLVVNGVPSDLSNNKLKS